MEKDTSVKRKNYLSFKQRIDIIKAAESGVSVQELATTYDVNESTIRRIKRRTFQILQYASQNKDTRKKKISKLQNEELDSKLYVWFLERKAVGDPVTNLLLREKASQLNRELGGSTNFKASRGWLSGFRDRYGIDTQFTIHSERGDADEAAVRFVHDVKQIIEERNINPANLYKLDEIGLAWKFLPKKMLTHTGRKRIDENRLKIDRITIGLCTNAIGNHKLPPLFIQKYAFPRALKHCKDGLPVIFKSQENAWLDKDLFMDWYENDFKPLVKKHQLDTGIYGIVLLIIDNITACNIPSHLLEDEIFNIILLPPSNAAIVQPIDQGMVDKTKRSFRDKMLRWMLNFSGGIDEFYSDYDVKDCIDILYDAWMSITPSNIQHAWHRLLKQTPQANLTNNMNDLEEFSNHSLQQTIKMVMGGNISIKEVDNWLSICAEVEQNIEENNKRKENSRYFPEHNFLLKKEEMEKMFQNLSLWSKNKPEFVQVQVQVLKNYYDQK